VLHIGQARTYVVRERVGGQDDTNRTVCFVNSAKSFDSQAIFRRPAAVTEPGGSIVTRSRVNFTESVSHANS
jgi:hypothetical protein